MDSSDGLDFDKFRETDPLILCAVSREHDRSLRDFKPYNFTVTWSSSNLRIRKISGKVSTWCFVARLAIMLCYGNCSGPVYLIVLAGRIVRNVQIILKFEKMG